MKRNNASHFNGEKTEKEKKPLIAKVPLFSLLETGL